MNWSGDVLPGAADDVVIDYGANDFAVVHSGGSTTIRSLNSKAAMSFSSSSFYFAVASSISNAVNIVGTVSFDSAAASLTTGNLSLQGELAGTADVRVTGMLSFVNISMIGTGTTYAEGGLRMENNALGYQYLGRPLVNSGPAIWAGNNLIYGFANRRIDNLAGATFEIQGNALYGGPSIAFNNYGTLRKTSGGGRTTINGEFNNLGLASVDNGELFLGYGTSSGTFTGAPGTGLLLAGQILTPTANVDADVLSLPGPIELQFTDSIGGTQFAQLVDRQGLNLHGDQYATLAFGPVGTFTPYLDEILTIIDNRSSSPVNGTFYGLPEGTTITDHCGNAFRISYIGGDGNDVTLTVVSVHVPPILTSTSGEISVNEGSNAGTSGTWGLGDSYAQTVTLAASIGDVTANPDGTWSWSMPTTDDLAAQSVVITATDDCGGQTNYSFDVNIANVDIAFEAGPAETLLPPQVGAFSRPGITFTDPGTIDTHTVTIDYDGDNVVDQTINVPLGERSFDLAHTYTADGVYIVTVTVQDDDGNPVTDTFQFTVILNTPPVAVDDSVSTDEDSAITFDVLSNDADDQGNIVPSLTVALNAPAAGLLTNNGDGTFSYDPNGAFDYLDVGETAYVSFDYQIEDSFGEIDTGKVTIAIHGVNDRPTIGVDNPSVTVDEGMTATISGTIADIDLSDTVTLSASIGTVTRTSGGTWTWSFDTSDGPAESQTVTITADDGNGGVSTVTFDLVVNNVAPAVVLAGPDSGVRGQTLSYSGSFTDPGADTHLVTWQVVDSTNAVVASGTGLNFAFTPVAGGSYVVTLTVQDDDGDSGSASINLTVTAVAVQTDSCDPTKTMLVVGGTEGNDSIALSPGSGSSVVVTINGVVQGTYSPTGRMIVYGQAGNDDLQVGGSLTNSAWIFGGSGHDRIKGGNGHDVLVGGDGDDLIIGGQGRDLLIGGMGADRIVGNADEDILIAGTTAFDANDHALCRLMAEWTSDNSFMVRFSNVSNGTGQADGIRLAGDDGVNQTVFEDNDADTLTGSQGQDWFFANRVADNGGVLDRVTDQAANELWSDTDF